MLKDALERFEPFNEQETKDKLLMMEYLDTKDIYYRNPKAHFTASAWIVNYDFSKVLLAYHNLYDSWAWLGGHADGEEDLKKVIVKEVNEEASLNDFKIIDDIFSLEILGVNGHIKKNEYISSHIHLNITYLIQADEKVSIKPKLDENRAVAWFEISDIKNMVSERWMNDNIYQKLNAKLDNYKNN